MNNIDSTPSFTLSPNLTASPTSEATSEITGSIPFDNKHHSTISLVTKDSSLSSLSSLRRKTPSSIEILNARAEDHNIRQHYHTAATLLRQATEKFYPTQTKVRSAQQEVQELEKQLEQLTPARLQVLIENKTALKSRRLGTSVLGPTIRAEETEKFQKKTTELKTLLDAAKVRAVGCQKEQEAAYTDLKVADQDYQKYKKELQEYDPDLTEDFFSKREIQWQHPVA